VELVTLIHVAHQVSYHKKNQWLHKLMISGGNFDVKYAAFMRHAPCTCETYTVRYEFNYAVDFGSAQLIVSKLLK